MEKQLTGACKDECWRSLAKEIHIPVISVNQESGEYLGCPIILVQFKMAIIK